MRIRLRQDRQGFVQVAIGARHERIATTPCAALERRLGAGKKAR
jgi:hypothetical protein